MRLIDADKLAKRIAGHSDYHGDSILAAIYCAAEGKENNEPIKPVEQFKSKEERKKGKWVEDFETMKEVKMKNGIPTKSCYCSVCKEWLTASDEYGVSGNFCPNCGADMRGEQNEQS